MNTAVSLRKKPIVLLILDGFGERAEVRDNAVLQANMPMWTRLRREYALGTIDASERMVGLPAGQFGNSEVGHLNIGAGRVVEQDITRIDVAAENGTLAENAVLQRAFAVARDKTLHLIGLLSDGGVHSHIEHFFAVLAAAPQDLNIVVHPFLDGRDTPPRSAEHYLRRLDDYCAAHPQVKIGAVIGRFFAMDRDNRWERVQAAYDVLTGTGEAFQAASGCAVLELAYARGENDEFVQASRVNDAPIQDGDAVLFLNFRADRARELTQALTFPAFDGFARARVPQPAYFASLTDYGADYTHDVMFAPQSIANGFGEYIAAQGLRQLRIAETEKYPHVTYFFNGGNETPYPLEERILVPSPKVATYDLQPEMSAAEVARHIVEAVEKQRFEVIVCNFANGDMVGHTGVMAAAIRAVEALDVCIGQIVAAVQAQGGEVLITADHGNCEQMFDAANDQVHTQHTTNPVPFLYIGEKARIKAGGALKDIAPTLLAMLGLPQPAEMTGENLIEWVD
ncbi:MAG: 2,3-bisphosphoglycerate-independent phosphoglycerate mutase [Neisseria sp.]|nr:2,3-bisphosphoglycerate-independent phosphoglycerate mutase [Neisseria sp.]